MGFVTNFLVPVFTGVVFLGLIVWICYVLYWLFKKIFPDFKWYFKYKIMKKAMPEKDVEWCINAIEMDWKKEDMIKFLLRKGKIDRIKEMCYIYDEVKKVKGGEDKKWVVTK